MVKRAPGITDLLASALMAPALQAPASGPGQPPAKSRLPGSTADRAPGQGHEIREIRPFAEGDDLRHLDAAASARAGSPQVRSFHEDRDLTLILIADFRPPMLWGTRHRLRSLAAAEALARLGWQAVQAGGAVGGIAITAAGRFVERPSPRARGMARVAGCLERAHAAAMQAALARQDASLAGDQPAGDQPTGGRASAQPFIPPRIPPLADELGLAVRLVPRGAAIALATALDQPGQDLTAALMRLRKRGPLRVLLVADALETTPPPEALPLRCAETSQRFRLDALPARLAEAMALLVGLGIAAEIVA